MGIERATTLYPRNSTVVDSGTGIDIRLLSATNGGTTENTNFVTAINTEDNVERTFDPASSNNNVADSFSLQKLGWALRLAEDMTPADDTNCNAYLNAAPANFNVILSAGMGWTGTPTSNSIPVWKASIWRYDLAADTGTLIASGSNNGGVWTTLQNNTFKTITIPVTLAAGVEFAQGETLLLQIGVNTGTLANPAVGTITYTLAVTTDNNVTRIQWAAATTQHIYQTCSFSSSLVGDGVATRDGLAGTVSRDLVGDGTTTRVLALTESKDLTGDGVVSRQLAETMTRDLTGDGVLSRQVDVGVSRDLSGDGVVTQTFGNVSLAFDLVGDGVVDAAKATVAAKSFDLVGDGTFTETHPVSAFRTFDLVGDGTISGSADIPFDDIPTGDCPSDWSPNDGLKCIQGDVFFHEPPNEGDPVVGAVVTLIRDSDGLRITTTITDAAGHYTFPRDTNDPNTYHVEVTWTDVGGDQQGLSEGGCVPGVCT